MICKSTEMEICGGIDVCRYSNKGSVYWPPCLFDMQFCKFV